MILQGHFCGFVFDFLTTSTIACDRSFVPVNTDVICLDIDEALVDGYANVMEHDEVSPLSYLNTGRIISSEQIRPYDEWINHPFYELHCKYFQIAKALTVSFRNPERFLTFLAFEYLASTDNKTWDGFTHERLELASLPFALGWFYRKGLMDDAALDRRLFALQDLTETQLTHIRKYVNSPSQSFQQQSADLEISEAWLKQSLYDARRELSGRLRWGIPTSTKAIPTSLRQLDREFRFMEMLGDPTSTIKFDLPSFP